MSANNYISLLDPLDVVEKKIKRAVTDSGTEVKSGADKPALTNLLTIYSLFSGRGIKEIEKEFEGKGYGAFKSGLAEVVVNFVKIFQNNFNNISDKRALKFLETGAEKARIIARKKMGLVKEKIGLI